MICYPSPLTSRWSSVDSWCSLQSGRPARSTTGTSSLRNRRRSCRHPTITVIDTATQYTIGIGATALWDPDIIVSQGSVAAYARCGGLFNIHLTANLPSNLPMKKNLKSVKIWQNYGHESVALLFGPPCRHTRNHPMGPVGRVPSNSGDRGNQVYIWSPPTTATGCHFSLSTAGSLYSASPDVLA